MTRAAYYREHRRRRFGLWVQWRTGCLVAMMRMCRKFPARVRPYAVRQMREAWDERSGQARFVPHAVFAAEKGWMGVSWMEPWVRDHIYELLRAGLVEVIRGYVREPSFDWCGRPVPRTWMCWLNLRPLFGMSDGWIIHSPLKLRGVS